MPNTKSAKKRMISNEKRRQRNFAYKSKIKTFVSRLKSAINERNKEQARQLLSEVYSVYDKAVKKGMIKARNAARRKSILSSKVNAING